MAPRAARRPGFLGKPSLGDQTCQHLPLPKEPWHPGQLSNKCDKDASHLKCIHISSKLVSRARSKSAHISGQATAPCAAAPCLHLLAWPASQIPALPPRFAQYGTRPFGRQGWDNSTGIPMFVLSQKYCQPLALWRQGGSVEKSGKCLVLRTGLKPRGQRGTALSSVLRTC